MPFITKFKKSILALAVSGVPLTSFALEATDLSEDDFLGEEIVYSSSVTRLKQEIKNIPASVTIITRDMIEASSATTPVELMRLVPGFQVGCFHGNDCTVTYHGLSNEHNTRLHVLLNGRSVYEPMFGGTLWYSLPITIDDIESIEVVRGPNAAAYGANSFSGVINIKTFTATSPGQDQAGYTYGHERDLHRLNLKQSGELERFKYSFSAGVESNNGFENSYQDNNDPGGEVPSPGNDVLAYYNDGADLLNLNLHLETTDSSGLHHQFEFGLKTGKMGVGFEGMQAYGIPESEMDLLSFYENYKIVKNTGLLKTETFHLSHSYTQEKNQFFDIDGGIDGNHPSIGDPDYNQYSAIFNFDEKDHLIWLDNDFVSQRLDLEYENQLIHSPSLQTVWGGGLRYDYSESDNFYVGNTEQDRLSSRLFGHVEWKASDFVTLNAGALVEKYENLDPLLSPRLAANFHINSSNTIRANVSRAYRVPSLYDLHANYFMYESDRSSLHDLETLGNPELDPERIDSIELGYLGNFFENKLVVDLRLAWEEITDVIETRKTGKKRDFNFPEWRTLNYGESDTESAEIDIFYKPSKSTFFKVSSAYANTHGYRANSYYFDRNEVNPTQKVYTAHEFTPKLTNSALISHTFNNGFSLSAQYAFVEAYTTGGNGDDLEALESVDLKLRKEFKIDNSPVEITATIKNIADADYEDFANENLVGLESYISLKVGL